MEAKKSSKADLEIRKNLFLEAGPIISLSLALVAFEWKSPVKNHIELTQGIIKDDIQDIIDISTHEMPKPKAIPQTFTRIDIRNCRMKKVIPLMKYLLVLKKYQIIRVEEMQ